MPHLFRRKGIGSKKIIVDAVQARMRCTFRSFFLSSVKWRRFGNVGKRIAHHKMVVIVVVAAAGKGHAKIRKVAALAVVIVAPAAFQGQRHGNLFGVFARASHATRRSTAVAATAAVVVIVVVSVLIGRFGSRKLHESQIPSSTTARTERAANGSSIIHVRAALVLLLLLLLMSGTDTDTALCHVLHLLMQPHGLFQRFLAAPIATATPTALFQSRFGVSDLLLLLLVLLRWMLLL